jgi:hypothetical protein
MSRRTRTAITVRKDDPVPRRHRKKKSDAIVIVFVLIVLALFVLSRTQRLIAPGHAQRPASLPTR